MGGPIHPALLMILFWCFIGSIYFFGPIYLTPAPSWSTCGFLALHIILFILGSTLFSRIVFFKNPNSRLTYISYIPNQHVQQVILTMLALGIAGTSISMLSKLNSVDILSFSSITQLRELRAQSLLNGGGIQSGLLSALAFLIYPAGFVGLVACIITYESQSLINRLMSFSYVVLIIFLAVCAGGRSPIMVLFLFIGISCYVRKKIGKSYIPKSLPIKLAIIGLIILFVLYSSMVWVARAKDAGYSTEGMMQHAEKVWGAHPKNYLLATSDWLNDPSFNQTVLSTTFYFTQSLSISERLLSSDKIPTLFGAYQIDVVAALLRAIPDGAEFLKQGYDILLNANVYGFFTGAWSGLFIDLSVFSFLAALIWGYFAGKSWLNVRRNPNVLTGIPYIFWTYSIFISFVSSPFGFSNSFMIFWWFIIFSFANSLFTHYKKPDPKVQLVWHS